MFYLGLSVHYSSRMSDPSCNSNTKVENLDSSLNKSFFSFFLCFFPYLWKWDVADSCVHGSKKDGYVHWSLNWSYKNAKVRLLRQCHCRSAAGLHS